MRTIGTVLVILLVSCVDSFATSTPPPPSLEDRVRMADHIFVGTVRRVEVLDDNDAVVTTPPTPLLHGTRIRLTVTPSPSWIRTPLKVIPESVTITYDIGKFILSLDNESQHYLNKEMVFLLKGISFSPVVSLAFAEPIDALLTIKAFLQQKPIEKASPQ